MSKSNSNVTEENTETDENDNPETISYGSTELKQIYPEPYDELYEQLHIMDRAVDIFIHCLGVRGTQRMGATAFRNFVRWVLLSK